MEFHSIISNICDQADDFLAGVFKRDEAQAGISEWLTIHHIKLDHDEKKTVVKEAMRVLEQEGFFEREAGEND